jgi:hypothetical protein
MSIKKLLLGSVAVSVVATVIISCGGSKTGPQSGGNGGNGGGGTETATTGGRNPFGNIHKMPCTVFDDENWFAGTGIANGDYNRMDVVQTAALTNAQNIVRQKMQHAYEGMVSDYRNYIGNNKGSDADIHMEAAGDQIIDVIVNNTGTVCGPEWSDIDEKGKINCYLGIKVSKKDVANKLAESAEGLVSKNEEMRIRFQEFNFREKMAEKFKAYKEERSK